jgi:hypothetical protein
VSKRRCLLWPGPGLKWCAESRLMTISVGTGIPRAFFPGWIVRVFRVYRKGSCTCPGPFPVGVQTISMGATDLQAAGVFPNDAFYELAQPHRGRSSDPSLLDSSFYDECELVVTPAHCSTHYNDISGCFAIAESDGGGRWTLQASSVARMFMDHAHDAVAGPPRITNNSASIR